MNIIIDQGNSRTKCTLFEGEEMQKSIAFDINQPDQIEAYIKQVKPLHNGIIASVSPLKDSLINTLRAHTNKLILFDHNTPLPIKNKYQTPHTLGVDRIVGAMEAYMQCPNTPALSIDLGTALTFDFVTAQGQYMGGSISPGLRMRLKALHRFTHKLPLVEVKEQHAAWGANTQDAIWTGVANGIQYEIEGQIAYFQGKHPDIRIFLTGGDMKYFENKLKNSIFAEPFLIEKGLNRILIYNEGIA